MSYEEIIKEIMDSQTLKDLKFERKYGRMVVKITEHKLNKYLAPIINGVDFELSEIGYLLVWDDGSIILQNYSGIPVAEIKDVYKIKIEGEISGQINE